ncbi:MAG: type II toxin-antitoxin system VapC family toxin [Deltaproteobacteria bacterium]|nr:type II toxin-antitoxin system VapC family toxin [Deltaproteobacteria bacterium]
MRTIGELLESIRTLDLNSAAADLAATVRRSLERKGNTIGMGDSLIAGIVLAVNGVLLTRNQRHFARIEGPQTRLAYNSHFEHCRRRGSAA